MAMLRTIGLTKDFGALQLLDHVDLEVEEGSLHSVVGPNGAGKTTFCNLISGFIKIAMGKVEFEGKEIAHLLHYRTAHLSIRRFFKVITLFPELTALRAGNLEIAVGKPAKVVGFEPRINIANLPLVLTSVGATKKNVPDEIPKPIRNRL
jgi:branched-chain amino acid transport system ATP-binding protein